MMTSASFDTLLVLEERWALGKSPHYITDHYWLALHLHDFNEPIGWLVRTNGNCSTCGAVFPKKVLGMLNMMNGLGV